MFNIKVSCQDLRVAINEYVWVSSITLRCNIKVYVMYLFTTSE
jgi:hypothetical protein